MTVMRTSYDYDKLVDLAKNVLYSFKMPEVEWLEPADVEAGRQLSGSGRNPEGFRRDFVALYGYAFSL